MELLELFERHYLPRRLRGKSPETSRLYRISIRNFGKTLGRPAVIADLTNDNLNWHMGRVMTDGRAKATANKDRAQLLALWRFASKHGMHNQWPEVPMEKEPFREPKAWLLPDIEALLSTIRGLPGTLRDTDIPQWKWWNALILVCLDTGERIGALTDAKWSWLENEWLLVPAESRKFGKRDKHFKLSQETIQSLELLRMHRVSESIFHWPYCSVYLWTKYRAILKASGLPAGRRDHFHRLRRVHASVIHAAGLDAQEALGHASKRTTEKYLDARFRKETQPSQILQSWLRGELNQRSPGKQDSA